MTDKPLRVQYLEEAANLTAGDREESYGSPFSTFTDIAHLWNVYLDTIVGTRSLNAEDVAHMMALVKIARTKASFKEDNYIDAAAYLAIAGECRHVLDVCQEGPSE